MGAIPRARHWGPERASRASRKDPYLGGSSWVLVAGAPLPRCDRAGRHLLSLGTNGMRRLFTFTWAGWIRHLPGGARLPTHGGHECHPGSLP